VTTIRRVEAQDRAAILELLGGTGAFQAHELDVAMELVDIALTKPEQQDYHPYVLEEHGLALAYACFGRNPMTRATYDLYWIASRSDRMKQGYGRAMFVFVEQEIKRQGGRLLVIETSSKDTYQGSRDFYTRVGCEFCACLPGFYDEGDDKLIYFKRL
jgi:GNAT superfamily N-acetyltransferase